MTNIDELMHHCKRKVWIGNRSKGKGCHQTIISDATRKIW